MNDNPNPTSSPSDFLAAVERLLVPVYTECFTDETRKVRNLLLLTSLVLILFVVGVVAVSDEVKLSPISLSITVRTGMRWLLMAICGYFLLLLCARSYIEWKLWRLRIKAPMTGLIDLNTRILSSFVGATNSANATLASSLDAFWRETEKLSDANVEPLAVSQLQKRRDDLFQQFEKSSAELATANSLSEPIENWTEHTKRLNRNSELFDEIDELDDQLRRERAERHKKFMDESEALRRQLDEAREDHERKLTAPELKVWETELAYIGEQVPPLSRILFIRRLFEMLFPILFGLLALLMGFVVRRTG